MENISILDENWHVLLSLFPPNWRELAKETGAMVRKFRSFTSEDNLMRTLLIHIARGYSLRETVVKAKASNIADISDVALLKRLKLSEHWFKELCQLLLKDKGVFIDKTDNSQAICMKLVDATNVKEPGKTGSLWRIHYSLTLPDLQCNYFKLTGTKGKGTGETFKQFPINKGDCIVGDRGYSTSQGIDYIDQKEAYSLVRVNTNGVCFYENSKKKFNLLFKMKKLQADGQVGEWEVKTKKEEEGFICGRLCVIRKSEEAIKQALKKLKKEAIKRQQQLKPETIEFAKYIIVFTTLPNQDFSARTILEWYRLRWQVELVFKRLKSLAGLGHLPKYDDASARAWLYGKLFVGLLTEKLIRQAGEISPWGYNL